MRVIYGNGGHGQDIADALQITRFYDDLPDRRNTRLRPPFKMCTEVYIGVNDPRQRRAIVERHHLTQRGTWLHPYAVVGPGCSFGEHVHINAGVTITRTTVGAFTTISPGANICGDVTIGETVAIGAGAVVCQFSTIGDGAVIAAGAVIPPHTNVPCGETWGGVPARRLS